MPSAGEPKPRVVICDDTPTIRTLVSELLKDDYEVLAVPSGEEALEKAPAFGPSLIITDLLMGGMDGIAVCKAVKAHPQLKRVPVVLLTTKNDSETRAQGLESGADDYLYKPFQERELLARVGSLVRLHQALNAESTLLAQTLSGSVRVLCDLLAMINPAVFGRSLRVRQLASKLAEALEMDERWSVEVAAMLSQIGYVTLPPATLQKLVDGQILHEREKAQVAALPATTEKLLAHIPRLEPVREILGQVDWSYGARGQEIVLGARVLRLALDYDTFESRGQRGARAFDALRGQSGLYDPHVLSVFARQLGFAGIEKDGRPLSTAQLKAGMVLDRDVLDSRGNVLLRRGESLTQASVELLGGLAQRAGVREPIIVRDL